MKVADTSIRPEASNSEPPRLASALIFPPIIRSESQVYRGPTGTSKCEQVSTPIIRV